MKQAAIIAVAVFAFAAVILNGQPQPPAAQGVQRWEYAEVYPGARGMKWVTPTATIQADSMQELADKTGRKTPKDGSWLVTILNAAGSEGWELVGAIPDREAGTHFYFKRPAR
jgi:hypothetical protein